MTKRKIGENNIEMTVLYILKTKGPMKTKPRSELKKEVIKMVEPKGINIRALLNRNDTAIHQIVGNIVSHRNDSKNNLIYRGLVGYENNELFITDAGSKFLDDYIVSKLIKDLRE